MQDSCIRIIVMCRGLAPFHYHYANSARLSSRWQEYKKIL